MKENEDRSWTGSPEAESLGTGSLETEPSGSPGSRDPAIGDEPQDRKFSARLSRLFRYSKQAAKLLWSTDKRLVLLLAFSTVLSGLVPAVVAYIGKLVIDAAVAAAAGDSEAVRNALFYVALDGFILIFMLAAEKVLGACSELLHPMLSHKVNTLVLEKTASLNLEDFEDDRFYDRLTQVRQGAATRPLELINRSFSILQTSISLAAYGFLLTQFSPWLLPFICLAGLPGLFVETHFADKGFELFRWRTPAQRKREYVQLLLGREDFAKEVKLLGLNKPLMALHDQLFHKVFARERSYILSKELWGYVFMVGSTIAFYAIYAWIVFAATQGRITIGDMTMYLVIFRQGQESFGELLGGIGGIYDDFLYLSHLYQFLEHPVKTLEGEETRGSQPGEGLHFDDVWFAYPGAEKPALQGVSFSLRPGQKLALVGENGSGKTTIVKLMARLYQPDQGKIYLDGTPLNDWDEEALRQRIGVIFQDFVRYQFTAGENIGIGDIRHWLDATRWERAAKLGMAESLISELPEGYGTQLGRWFDEGREVSGGQWQKLALSRLFMRSEADILVLDEPTAAMDAEAEAELFERFQSKMTEQMALVISHRFSTVRLADHIIVLENGIVIERGSHEEMMMTGGRYAHLFELQAAGYR